MDATLEGNLECTKCNSVVYVKFNLYGTSWRFMFRCKCNELDLLSRVSFIETLDEATNRIKEWKQKKRMETKEITDQQIQADSLKKE